MVTEDMLSVGEGVRTGYKLSGLKGLVIHWIGVAQPSATVIRKNFASASYGTHYISDWNSGDIIQCVPDDEVCYHVGATSYTDLKTQLVGSGNPNWYFVGVECCISASDVIASDYYAEGKYFDLGGPSVAQYSGLVSFCSDFLSRHGLTSDDLYLHNDITGKSCHIWFLKDKNRWNQFKADVASEMKGEIDVTREELEEIVFEVLADTLSQKSDEEEKMAEQVSSWAESSWEKAKLTGLFDGTYPGNSLTREQCAVVLDRLKLL